MSGKSGGRGRSGGAPVAAFRMESPGGGYYRLSGELTFATVSEALRVTAPLFADGAALHFDLSRVDRADSAGVALLIEWVRRAWLAGGDIRYAHLPASIRAIIRVSGVEALLPMDSAPTGT